MGASDKKEESHEDERDEKEGDESHSDKAHADDAGDHDDEGTDKKEPAKAKADEKKADEKPAEKAVEKAPVSAKPAAEASTKAKKDDADEDDEEDEGDDEEGDEEEGDEDVAAKPAPKPAAKPAAAGAKKSSKANPYAAAPPSPGRTKGRGKAPPPPSRAQGGSLTKNMILFIGIIGVLAAGFAYLGKEEPQGAAPVKNWKVGETADVEITLVPTDIKELACGAPDEIAGKHCGFEVQGKPWSKGDPKDEKKTLRPYTTTDRIQFLAAGLWSQDALASGKLPTTRFSVKCKYTVDGKLKNPNIRWSAAQPEQWFPQTSEWYAGSVSQCVLAPP